MSVWYRVTHHKLLIVKPRCFDQDSVECCVLILGIICCSTCKWIKHWKIIEATKGGEENSDSKIRSKSGDNPGQSRGLFTITLRVLTAASTGQMILLTHRPPVSLNPNNCSLSASFTAPRMWEQQRAAGEEMKDGHPEDNNYHIFLTAMRVSLYSTMDSHREGERDTH